MYPTYTHLLEIHTHIHSQLSLHGSYIPSYTHISLSEIHPTYTLLFLETCSTYTHNYIYLLMYPTYIHIYIPELSATSQSTVNGSPSQRPPLSTSLLAVSQNPTSAGPVLCRSAGRAEGQARPRRRRSLPFRSLCPSPSPAVSPRTLSRRS